MFSRRENDKPLHLGLTPHCGLCGSAMLVGDACTSLLGIDRATRYQRCIKPFAYPKYGFFHGEWGVDYDDKDYEDSDDDPLLCRNPECSKGTADLEACTVHVDCRVLFQRMAAVGGYDDVESGDRLWIAAAWQRPWRQAAWLWLDQPDDRRVALSQVIAAVGDIDDNNGDSNEMSLKQILHGMQRLPPELVQIIHDMSSASLTWRLASVVGRFHYTSAHDGQHTTLPLDGIAAWERGNPASNVEPGAVQKPVIRLTMDHRGLCTIERLATLPTTPHRCIVHNEAYAIVNEKDVKGVIVHFRYGLARLELPFKLKGIHIWDTPSPPLLDDCNIVLKRLLPATRFQTVPLDRADGITFIFEHTKVEAVHVHTPATPAARSTVLSLDDTNITWVYVPIATDDRVLAVGVRRCGYQVRNAEIDQAYAAEQEEEEGDSDEEKEMDYTDYGNMYRDYSMGYLFRFEKAGDVYVGPMMSEPREDTLMASTPPISLLYSTLESFILSVVGAYSGSSTPLPKPLPPLSPPFGEHQFRPTLTANDQMSKISTAPLDGIVRVRVFTDPVRGFDRGLLFFYENGGQRALGQCRVGGVDNITDYERPACLCVTRDGYTHVIKKPAPREPGTQTWHVFYAQCADELEHVHNDHDDEEGGTNIWLCIPLGKPGCGQLQMTFSSKSGKLEVYEDDEDLREWREKRHDASFRAFVRPRKNKRS
ncbi:hypothetical protein SBRCBS47491_008990 [Sporothrix bragantina]|uniref:F-box domain containing protein n=1 Tax=Sporothrix bragantina TaxID=671064 RepID=A0ABP0CR39_9PEZI